MLKTSRPALALLAAGCSLLFLLDGVSAQTGSNPKKTTKKSQPIQPVQAVDDDRELEAPPPRAKNATSGSTGAKRKPIPRNDADHEVPPAKAPARQPRPDIQPDRVEKLSPELETLLKDWEINSAKVKKLVGDFKRFKYDKVFSVELRAEGKFAYESPDKGYYQFEGTEIPAGVKSRKSYTDKDPNTGKIVQVPFSLKPDTTEHWVCDGEYIFKINDRDRQFERVPIPPENRGQNIIDGPLPFLFGMKADRAKRRYTFEMMDSKPEFPSTVWLLVRPRLPMDASNWSEARVGINQKTFLPVAVMLTDPSGNSETVHLFSKVEANPKQGILPALFGGGNPFQPDLRKYKMVQNEKEGSIDGADPDSPGVSSRPPSTPGTRPRVSADDRNPRDLPRSADASAGGTRSTKKSASK